MSTPTGKRGIHRGGKIPMGDRRINGSSGGNRDGGGRNGTQRDNRALVIEPYNAPRDKTGNVISVPIQLIMECGKESEGVISERIRFFMGNYVQELKAVAREFGVDVIQEEEIQSICEGSRCVLPLQVVCDDWQSTLTLFSRQFFVRVWGIQRASYEMPLISTSSQLFPLRLVSSHINLDLERVKFGSLLDNGLLGIHWLMEGGLYRAEDRELGVQYHKGIYAYFDYEKKVITCEYRNRDQESYEGEEINSKGKITVEMSSINRIFFDQVNDEHGDRHVSIVLLINSPPRLQTQRLGEKGAQANEPQFPWENQLRVYRGRYPGEIPHKEALAGSKLVVFEFEEHKIREKMQDRTASIEQLFFDMLSRLHHNTGLKIEFSSFYHDMMLEGNVIKHLSYDKFAGELQVEKKHVHPYNADVEDENGSTDCVDFDDRALNCIWDAAEYLMRNSTGMTRQSRDYHVGLKAFRLRSLLQAILDRGMDYRVELLRDSRKWHDFVEMSSNNYANDEEKTMFALERVLCVLNEGNPNCSISSLLKKELADSTESRRMVSFSDKDRMDGYKRIMKFLIKPTRIIFVGYEVIMGNRVLNKYAKKDENHIIRVTFREDNGKPMWAMNYGKEVQDRIMRVLLDGIKYAGRNYEWLGNSNSQLRDQGIYMIHVDKNALNNLTAIQIRCDMGKFYELPNIPKMLARLGQVFTQSKTSICDFRASDVGVSHELIGGMKSDGKPFIFSDGVGRISAEHAALLCREHGITSASAFQIRFRGEKGLLCVDPLMDERNELLRFMGKKEDKKVFIRPSMSKFEVKYEDYSNLEIVKYSISSPVFLSNPFINILCQVSEWQSAESHRRIRGRVKELMYAMRREIIRSLYIEHQAIESLREMAFPIMMETFAASSGLDVTTEPFFRSLLLASAKYGFKKQLSKMRVRIPTSLGRTMFGVIDTTGFLQYGQIFCQYSGSTSKRVGRVSRGGSGVILTGPTLVTKNPCHAPGDVRMFEAIDIPSLRHLVDVIVFPSHGPRPHPDEMAGSDLDGDEYIVIWDEQLFLDRNEKASDYPIEEDKVKWAIPRKIQGGFNTVDVKKCEELKAAFYTEAIVQGQPGALCTSHLVISDLYGLDSKPARSLERKIAQTLDYQKTGIKPAERTMKSEDDPDDENRVIPAENSKLKPDFLRKYLDPGYQSRGILGELFRETCKYDDAIECDEMKETIVRDPSIVVSEWERYRRTIEEELANYSYSMTTVLGQYGISTEAELLSGMIISLKNRLSDKEEDDGTMYNTNKVIEAKCRKIFEETREKFFSSFHHFDWREELEVIESRIEGVRQDSILHRRVKSNTNCIEGIRRKAAAAYNVAYEAASIRAEKGEQAAIHLSFPWLFADVLLDIKTRPDKTMKRDELEEEREQSSIPLAKKLSELIDRYCEEPSNVEKFSNFMERYTIFDEVRKDDPASILPRSLKENQGLARVSFVLLEWANHIGAFSSSFREDHLLSLFILFGLGLLNNRTKKLIQKPQGQRVHTKKGEHLLLFIDFVSSEEFRMRSYLSFAELGGGVMMRGRWRAFSETALFSFIRLVATHRLDLPMNEGVETVALKEFDPRVMQLPDNVITDSHKVNKVRDALLKVSGCADVKLRVDDKKKLVMVSAIGSRRQLAELAKYIYPPAPTRAESTLKGKIESLPDYTHERLMRAAEFIP